MGSGVSIGIALLTRVDGVESELRRCFEEVGLCGMSRDIDDRGSYRRMRGAMLYPCDGGREMRRKDDQDLLDIHDRTAVCFSR